MSWKLNKIAKSLLVAILALGLTAPASTTVSAKRYHYHYRINRTVRHRRYRHHYARRFKRSKRSHKRTRRKRLSKTALIIRNDKRKYPNLVPMNTKYEINTQLKRAKSQELHDLQEDRHSVGLKPLHESRDLDKIASQRAKQIVTNFNHKNRQGIDYYMIDGYNDNIPIYNQDYSGENIAEEGHFIPITAHDVYQSNGTYAGNTMNYNMWNQEKGATPSQDGGHRKNIESVHYHNVGIGTNYNRSGKMFTSCEIFSS